jgi:hypothetical protein
MEMARKLTRPMRWHEICRAALIIGEIEEYDLASTMKLRKRIMARLATGKITHEKKVKDERPHRCGEPIPNSLK